MSENDIAKIVVDCSFRIHKKFGPCLLESAYEKLLTHELHKSKLKFQKQKSIPIEHDNILLETGFRADLIVENRVIIELKSVKQLNKSHEVQLVNYLVATKKDVGLLLNFGETKVQVKRKVREL